MEAQIALAMLLRRWHIVVASERPAEVEATVTLRVKGGLPVCIRHV
jgi:cytochrome P450